MARFGREQVFKDVDSIELGDDLGEAIARAVGSCDALIAFIGNEWLTATDKQSRRRIDDPNDFVRLELEAALQRDVRVIPILIDDAAMPPATCCGCWTEPSPRRRLDRRPRPAGGRSRPEDRPVRPVPRLRRRRRR